MNSRRASDNVSPLKPGVHDPLFAGERRANPRHASHQVKLTFLGADHVALNWSRDGVLVADHHPRVPVGTRIEGVLTVGSFDGRYKFAAELVRRDARARETAWRFIKPSQALIDVLTRIAD
ncbi:MAG TPA: hypothetical protein VMU87_20670 [Stellaceae bacterium]|nr:hypothetical protein [Stellaceae bacterium]